MFHKNIHIHTFNFENWTWKNPHPPADWLLLSLSLSLLFSLPLSWFLTRDSWSHVTKEYLSLPHIRHSTFDLFVPLLHDIRNDMRCDWYEYDFSSQSKSSYQHTTSTESTERKRGDSHLLQMGMRVRPFEQRDRRPELSVIERIEQRAEKRKGYWA